MVACRNFLITWITAYIGSSVMNLVSQERTDVFFRQFLWMGLFIAGFLAFDITGIFWQSVTIHEIRNELRGILYGKVLKARYDKIYYLGQKGELLTRINSDVDMVSSFLSYGLLSPLMALISGIGATVTVAVIHWKLCILIYAVGLLCWGIQIIMIRKERPVIAQLQENKTAALGLCSENFQNGLTVRLCGLVDAFEEKVMQNLSEFERISCRLAQRKAVSGLCGTLLQYLQSVGMLFVGLFLHMRGEIRLGDIVILYQMAALITNMITSISNGYASLQNWIVSIGRLHDILDLEEETDGPEAKELDFCADAEYGIRVEGVSCRFDGYTIYEDLNLEVEKKGLYIMMGESGKGKTTFFRLLMGIYPYAEGNIALFGHDRRSICERSIRSQITYMTQENALFQGTVRENILWRSKASEDEIVALLKRMGLDKWILGLEKGLDTTISNGGTEFSGGQRKCLLLARALLEQSMVYLLDEAFTGVDEKYSKLIWEELYMVAERALVIVITHDESVLEGLEEKKGRMLVWNCIAKT